MIHFDFAQNISPSILDEFYNRKKAIRLQNKRYKRKFAVNTSVAAALIAAFSGGIWIIGNDGTPDTSDAFLQNPSDVSVDEVETSVTDVSEVSTDGIDWEAIKLNAVYWEYDGFLGNPIRDEILVYWVDKPGMCYTYHGIDWAMEEHKDEPERVFAVMLFPTHFENGVRTDYKAGGLPINVGEKIKGCLEYLEDYGMHIERKFVDVFQKKRSKEEDIFVFEDEFLVSYMTAQEIVGLVDYMKQIEVYGLCIDLAPCFLRDDGTRAYTMHSYYADE